MVVSELALRFMVALFSGDSVSHRSSETGREIVTPHLYTSPLHLEDTVRSVLAGVVVGDVDKGKRAAKDGGATKLEN
jgi:hypothetical protein